MTASMTEAGSLTEIDEQNPWPGLAPFTEEAERFFFGRKAEAAELLRRVLREPSTVLFGKSGLGKSSLLQAGLFPRLRRAAVFPVYLRLDVLDDKAPLIEQAAAAFRDALRRRGIKAAPFAPGETLWEYLHRADLALEAGEDFRFTPLLVFDQFEEIFTLGGRNPAAVAQLCSDLGDLIENRIPAPLFDKLEGGLDAGCFDLPSQRARTLISLREEYLPDLDALAERIASLGRNRMRLNCMNGVAAKEVVAQARELIEPRVAERVVRFVAGAGPDQALESLQVEPSLLSLFCHELNSKRKIKAQSQEGARITKDLLVGSREEILKGFYDRGIAGLPPEVAIFVEDKLLTESGCRDSIATETALRRLTLEEINCLVERRLIRREQGGVVERLELIHDCLTEVITACRERRREEDRAAQKLPIPYQGEEPYLFCSFSPQDGAAVSDLARMAELGFRISYDRENHAGEEWKQIVGPLIDRCELFVLFVSPQSMRRISVRDALAWATDRKKRMLPVFLLPPATLGFDSKELEALLNRKCINRFRYSDPLGTYYAALTEEFPVEARRSAEDRDCQILGLGELPELWDIVNGKLSLSEDEKQQKHQLAVQEVLSTLRKTGSVAYSIETIFQLTAEETGAEERLRGVRLQGENDKRPTNLLSHPLNIGTWSPALSRVWPRTGPPW